MNLTTGISMEYLKTILEAQNQGIDILLNIDVNGVSSLRKFCSTQEGRGRLKRPL